MNRGANERAGACEGLRRSDPCIRIEIRGRFPGLGPCPRPARAASIHEADVRGLRGTMQRVEEDCGWGDAGCYGRWRS